MAGSIWAVAPDGSNYRTKKALAAAVEAGEEVQWIDTSRDVDLPLNALRPGDVIVGPNPYRKRDWYGKLVHTQKGPRIR